MTRIIKELSKEYLTGPPVRRAASRARAPLRPDAGWPVRDRFAPPRERLRLAPGPVPGRRPAGVPRPARLARSGARKRGSPLPALLPRRFLDRGREAGAPECPGTAG